MCASYVEIILYLLVSSVSILFALSTNLFYKYVINLLVLSISDSLSDTDLSRLAHKKFYS